jgi:LemA protein
MVLLGLFLSAWIVALLVAATLMLILTAFMVYLAGLYRSLVAGKNRMGRSFSDLEVLLKRRHDELPKLIETCKGYMASEPGTWQDLKEARAALARAGTPAEKAQAEELEGRALEALWAAVEKRADLRANRSFLELRLRLAELETRIAAQRNAYHQEVSAFKTRLGQAPAGWLARLMGLGPRSTTSPKRER